VGVRVAVAGLALDTSSAAFLPVVAQGAAADQRVHPQEHLFEE